MEFLQDSLLKTEIFPAVSGRNRQVSGCFEKRCLTEGNVGILRIFLAFLNISCAVP